jgi:molecular chaperone GrpE
MPSKRENDRQETTPPEGSASAGGPDPEGGTHPPGPDDRVPEGAGATEAPVEEVVGGEGGPAASAADGSQGPAGDEAAGPEAPAEPDERDRRIEELASRLEEANARHLRLAADFDNFRKRARQEQLETMRFAAATVAERLLPVLDDAKLALDHAPAGVDQNWLKGVRLTFQKLEEVLASVGVERIESVGVRFDPSLHEAVGAEESGDHPEDTVVAELRPGYRIHDRVLRPALVRVARPPSRSE